MKNEKLHRKLGFLIGILVAGALLLAGCQNIFDSPARESQSGYGRVLVDIGEGGSARTIRPVEYKAGDWDLEYEFLTSAGAELDFTPGTDTSGVYVLPVGSYKVKVTAKDKTTHEVVADGISNVFNVYADSFSTVTVQLIPKTTGTGTFTFEITVPKNSEATLVLKQYVDGEFDPVASFNGAAYSTSGTDPIVITSKTGGVELDAGSYVFYVTILKTDGTGYGGVTEAVQIFANMTSAYEKVFKGEDLAQIGNFSEAFDILKNEIQSWVEAADPDALAVSYPKDEGEDWIALYYIAANLTTANKFPMELKGGWTTSTGAVNNLAVDNTKPNTFTLKHVVFSDESITLVLRPVAQYNFVSHLPDNYTGTINVKDNGDTDNTGNGKSFTFPTDGHGCIGSIGMTLFTRDNADITIDGTPVTEAQYANNVHTLTVTSKVYEIGLYELKSKQLADAKTLIETQSSQNIKDNWIKNPTTLADAYIDIVVEKHYDDNLVYLYYIGGTKPVLTKPTDGFDDRWQLDNPQSGDTVNLTFKPLGGDVSEVIVYKFRLVQTSQFTVEFDTVGGQPIEGKVDIKDSSTGTFHFIVESDGFNVTSNSSSGDDTITTCISDLGLNTITSDNSIEIWYMDGDTKVPVTLTASKQMTAQSQKYNIKAYPSVAEQNTEAQAAINALSANVIRTKLIESDTLAIPSTISDGAIHLSGSENSWAAALHYVGDDNKPTVMDPLNIEIPVNGSYYKFDGRWVKTTPAADRVVYSFTPSGGTSPTKTFTFYLIPVAKFTVDMSAVTAGSIWIRDDGAALNFTKVNGGNVLVGGKNSSVCICTTDVENSVYSGDSPGDYGIVVLEEGTKEITVGVNYNGTGVTAYNGSTPGIKFKPQSKEYTVKVYGSVSTAVTEKVNAIKALDTAAKLVATVSSTTPSNIMYSGYADNAVASQTNGGNWLALYYTSTAASRTFVINPPTGWKLSGSSNGNYTTTENTNGTFTVTTSADRTPLKLTYTATGSTVSTGTVSYDYILLSVAKFTVDFGTTPTGQITIAYTALVGGNKTDVVKFNDPVEKKTRILDVGAPSVKITSDGVGFTVRAGNATAEHAHVDSGTPTYTFMLGASGLPSNNYFITVYPSVADQEAALRASITGVDGQRKVFEDWFGLPSTQPTKARFEGQPGKPGWDNSDYMYYVGGRVARFNNIGNDWYVVDDPGKTSTSKLDEYTLPATSGEKILYLKHPVLGGDDYVFTLRLYAIKIFEADFTNIPGANAQNHSLVLDDGDHYPVTTLYPNQTIGFFTMDANVRVVSLVGVDSFTYNKKVVPTPTPTKGVVNTVLTALESAYYTITVYPSPEDKINALRNEIQTSRVDIYTTWFGLNDPNLPASMRFEGQTGPGWDNSDYMYYVGSRTADFSGIGNGWYVVDDPDKTADQALDIYPLTADGNGTTLYLRHPVQQGESDYTFTLLLRAVKVFTADFTHVTGANALSPILTLWDDRSDHEKTSLHVDKQQGFFASHEGVTVTPTAGYLFTYTKKGGTAVVGDSATPIGEDVSDYYTLTVYPPAADQMAKASADLGQSMLAPGQKHKTTWVTSSPGLPAEYQFDVQTDDGPWVNLYYVYDKLPVDAKTITVTPPNGLPAGWKFDGGVTSKTVDVSDTVATPVVLKFTPTGSDGALDFIFWLQPVAEYKVRYANVIDDNGQPIAAAQGTVNITYGTHNHTLSNMTQSDPYGRQYIIGDINVKTTVELKASNYNSVLMSVDGQASVGLSIPVIISSPTSREYEIIVGF